VERDRRQRMLRRLGGLFEQLFKHGIRDTLVPYDHIFRRILVPMCRILAWIEENGTAKDFSEALSIMSNICKKRIASVTPSSSG